MGDIIAASEWATTRELAVGLKIPVWGSDDTGTRHGRAKMPDDPSHPPDPPRDDALDPTDQLDVEAALAEAAGLSSKLSSEIGTADIDLDADGGEAGVNAQDVEAQLGEVEQLLTEVAHGGTGESAASAKESGKETGETASAAPSGDKEDEPPAAIGTEPSPEASDMDAHEEHATVVAVGPAAGDDTANPLAEAADASAHVTPVDPVPESALKVPESRTLGARLRSVREATAWRSRTILDSTARALLFVLDAVDGVFSWINLRARRTIGWIALVIFTAACSITIYSLSH